MHRPGPAARLIRPRNAALHGEVDLECPRPVPIPTVGTRDPARQPLAGDLSDRARCQIEDDDICAWQIRQRKHAYTRLDPPAVLEQHRRERVGNRARAATGDWPAEPVASRGQGHPNRGAQRAAERAEGMSCDAPEQGTGLRPLPQSGQDRRRHRRGQAEPRECDRVTRQVQDRAQQILAEGVEVGRRRCEQPPPHFTVAAESTRRVVQRPKQNAGAAIVERVREVDLGPAPLKAVLGEPERVQKRRPCRHRMHGRAVVVEQAWDRQLTGPRPTPDRLLGLEYRNPHARTGQRHRAGEPIGSRTDDDRLAQDRPSPLRWARW